MIDMEELKPIIEPLLTEENSTDIIERITALDKPAVTQADIDRVNKEWGEKYRKTFFEGTPGSKEEGPKDPIDTNESLEETHKEKTRFEDLFSQE